MLHIFITILILIAAILLIVVVLIQKSKGGGLASNFQGVNQIAGVKTTTNFVEKATWTLAIVICVLSIISSFTADQNLVKGGSRVQSQQPTEQTATSFPTEKKEAPAAAQETPAAAPAAEEAPAK